MECYECGVTVKPQAYPEGECPSCGLTYTLPDKWWPECSECGAVGGDPCLDCLVDGP